MAKGCLRVVLFFAATCLGFSHADAAEVRLLSTDYPPYFASSLPNGGPLTEIVVEAYKRVGYGVSMEFVPWIRAMEHGKAGKVDGLHGAWHSREREQWFLFSKPLPGNELVLLKRKGEGPEAFESFGELKPYTIGVVKGYRNPVALEIADVHTDEASSDATNIKKVARGRVDLILIERAVAQYLLAEGLSVYRESLVVVEPPVEVLPLYLMISRKTDGSTRKLNDFNRGLELLHAEGGIERILMSHGMTPAGGS